MPVSATVLRSNRAQTAVENNDSDVPGLLLEKATDLYGERGCHAVSIREIIRQAGVLHEAAVRNCFGNKHGLLNACVSSIADQSKPIFASRWAGLSQRREANEATTVPSVVNAVAGGMVSLYSNTPIR